MRLHTIKPLGTLKFESRLSPPFLDQSLLCTACTNSIIFILIQHSIILSHFLTCDNFLTFPNSLSGESSGLSGLKAPTPNGSLIQNKAPVLIAASSTEKSSLLLQMLSSSANKSSNGAGNGFLTDKEISAKNVAAATATKSNQTKLSDDQPKTTTAVTSPSSSSFLKSMLNVSSAPPPISIVTPESKHPVRTAPPPLSASSAYIESAHDNLSEPAGIGAGADSSAESETQGTPAPSVGSPFGNSSRGGNGGGLIPGVLRLKSMAKKEKSVAAEPLPTPIAPVPTPVSVPSPSPIRVPVPSSTSAPTPTTSSSLAFIAATSTSTSSASSFPSVTVSSSASASLIAALSIQTKPAVERGLTPPPPPHIVQEVTTGETNVPRRMSVSQLFQSQSKISIKIPKNETAEAGGVKREPSTGVEPSVSVATVESGSRSTVTAAVVCAGPSQQKESSSKSASLCSMLNMPQKDAKLSEQVPAQVQVPFKSSQQSKAMPSTGSPARNANYASPKSFVSAASGSTISLTPQALAKVELADPKNTTSTSNAQTRAGITGSSPSPFFASSSVYSSAQPPTSTSPPIFSARKLTPTKSSGSSPMTIPVPQGLPPAVPDISSSPSSYIISALSQYISLSAGFTSHPVVGAVSKVDKTQSQAQSQIQSQTAANSAEILELVQGPPSTPSPAMKSLSPSDLTGYIRKF